MVSSYWVYLLECKDGSFYAGMTTDVERRAQEHNDGLGAKYTRGRGPVKVVYREECANKSEALKREIVLKKLSRAQKLKLIENSPECKFTGLVEAIKEEFSFDFVGLAPAPENDPPELMWHYAAGNTNQRFRRIVLPPGVGVMGIVYGSQRPLIVENVHRDIPRKDHYQYPIVAAEGLESFFALPLKESEAFAGILMCAYRSDHALPSSLIKKTAAFITKQDKSLSANTTDPVRPTSEFAESTYGDTTHKVLQAQEEERKRISRELHDGISHEILLAQIELRKLKYLPPDEKDAGIEQASEYLRLIMKHVNAIAVGLRPAQLDELGIGPAIKAYGLMLQDAYGVTVLAKVDQNIKLSSDEETALYRIFQEAASNACKYSRAETIQVTLRATKRMIKLIIEDSGIGFDADKQIAQGSGLGLVGMRERADIIGGSVRIESAIGKGTRVELSLPLKRSES